MFELCDYDDDGCMTPF
jgi:hypothetical protein